ncbi:hypothetical protein [Neisseria shayeganii]|uniref:Uncharacterized protein n=1 Tax=Neisseria shayeganii 871 TaxID=1032488 RepID=G4CKI1_9NEIS|nr:hypothetical protein [Neisseria shayeganii]EGY51657.1 hypothetical protein HMPREF9371_2121 [Neisseria shayeganii 871]
MQRGVSADSIHATNNVAAYIGRMGTGGRTSVRGEVQSSSRSGQTGNTVRQGAQNLGGLVQRLGERFIASNSSATSSNTVGSTTSKPNSGRSQHPSSGSSGTTNDRQIAGRAISQASLQTGNSTISTNVGVAATSPTNPLSPAASTNRVTNTGQALGQTQQAAKPVESLGDMIRSKYQEFYDQGYANTMREVQRGRLPNNNRVIGNKTDAYARVELRKWLQRNGIPEGPNEIVRINRRLYDPSGSGRYRVPDVHIPSENLILDGSLGFKTNSSPQIRDFYKFGNGANTTIIVPSGFGDRGSYSITPRR